jgi:quercetin dioxygenase-like cupin family protein
MRIEIITQCDTLVIRRLVLEPGEVTPWHTDACKRFSVVVRGERLCIEYRDAAEHSVVAVHPGSTAGISPIRQSIAPGTSEPLRMKRS